MKAANLSYVRTPRLTRLEYEALVERGTLDENDPIELIDGYLVQKMPRNPPHDSCIQKLTKRVMRLLPLGWDARCQMAVTLSGLSRTPR